MHTIKASGYVDARSWRDRAVPLRDQLTEDHPRHGIFKLLHPKTSHQSRNYWTI